jgi:CopG family transcriptional regulator, nickel-responsive regulator
MVTNSDARRMMFMQEHHAAQGHGVRKMQRITIALDDELVAALDRTIAACGYQNRSEAIRDLARAGLARLPAQSHNTHAGVAALVYVYDHQERELAKRLTGTFHDRHDLSVASMHVHLDHDSCLEVSVLRGALRDIQHFAQHVIAERGVRHGHVVTIPVELEDQQHPHGAEPSRRHLHVHVKEA